MTLKNISPAQHINAQLRKAVIATDLIDYNATNRSSNYGNWIYPDRPMLAALLGDKNNFPRVSIESLPCATVEEMGMEDPSHLQNVSLNVSVWSVRDLICGIVDTNAEPHTFITGTDTYELTALPASLIESVSGTMSGSPHNFVVGTDCALIDADGDGLMDTIDWSVGGNVPDDGTEFLVDYVRRASGAELARIIAQNINAYLRTWRGWSEKIILGYKLLSSNPVPYDENVGVFRYEMIVQFEGIDLGEIV